MTKLFETSLILLSALLVGIGDVWLKKAAFGTDSFRGALLNRWTLAATFLYLVQIVVFSYLFSRKAELGFVGVIQITFYAIIVVSSGVLLFHEALTAPKILGMLLALTGVIILDLSS